MAAKFLVLGIEPMGWLEELDPDKRNVMQAALVKAGQVRNDLDRRLARYVAAEVWGGVKFSK